MASSSEIRNIILECRLLPGQHSFAVSAHATIGQLLDEILEMLEKSIAAEQARNMLEYYQPQLQVLRDDELRYLDHRLTLEEAGLRNGDVCRIQAEPRKGKQLFCQWC